MKDMEVQVLKELNGHPNISALHGAFVSNDTGEARMNLVMEFLSDTLHRVIKHNLQMKQNMDVYYVKLYTYQLLRGLGLMHNRCLVHCDIKPQNLLLDGRSHTLKICDFGTARRMVHGETNRHYVCSRYYRAPEIILGSTTYTTSVDIWSAGCVFAEMLLGQPLFTGKDGIDQFVEIIKVLGTPSASDLQGMNPNYPLHTFTPEVKPHPWDKVFRGWSTKEADELADMLMRYDLLSRTPPMHCLMHRFFDALRIEKPSHKGLFEFRPDELWWTTSQERERLIPRWMHAKST
jgi:serine/threonine protein kinase